MSSKGSYLPKYATIDEATLWLEEATGESWPLSRLLESGHHLRLGIWFRPDDHTPPEVMRKVFENRVEGFWAPLSSMDEKALMADKTLVVTMTQNPSGLLVSFTPGLEFSLDDLRAEGASIEAMVESLKPENRSSNVGHIHTPKRRTSALDAVIDAAKSRALVLGDWASAWAALVEMAKGNDRPAPLLGYTEGDGVKYQTDSDSNPVAFLSREAFRKRLTRRRAPENGR